MTDPSGEEQAARVTEYAEARRLTGPPRLFRIGPDVTMHEVSLDSL
ncbi:hypothetical protein GA0070603_1595 [Micromonospora chersina]|uniref:Uncharacterized protein n=1 Tax=Micromonospora chersina TaxID=47854 RepID=A0A1C6UHG5_9ACTN|nr:hypothetical protein GA0070603_1595 [Micromonospora chersina]